MISFWSGCKLIIFDEFSTFAFKSQARAKTIDGKNKKLELKVHMSLKGTHMLLEPKLKEPTADPEE